MARMILDSGAVIALAGRKPLARMFLERALREETLVVPSVVIAEATRGGPRDAPIDRVLKEVDEITPVTGVKTRVAGRMLAETGLTNAIVNALVAAEAVIGDASMVLTGDVADLTALVANQPHVRVHGI